MRVFLSADIEGTAGIAHWDEVQRTHSVYAEFQALMTAEVVAACEGTQLGRRRSSLRTPMAAHEN